MGIYSILVTHLWHEFIMDSTAQGKARTLQLGQVHGDILEAGFGTGLNLPHDLPQEHKMTTVAPNLEINRRAIRKARAYDVEVDSYVLNGEHLPFAGNHFDSAVLPG